MFCGECGSPLAEKGEAERAKRATEAERKQVTALFSDLSGYTAMTERLDPEEVKDNKTCVSFLKDQSVRDNVIGALRKAGLS